jgi:hypothetical protein
VRNAVDLRSLSRWTLLSPLALILVALASGGCKKTHTTDLTPLDRAGLWFNDVQQLRDLDLSDAEVQQLAAARQSGLSDQDCIAMVHIARERHQPFADGQIAAMLIDTGLSEPTVMALERLNQLGLGSGEAQAMHLAHLSDQVILAIAERRAAGQPTMSGAKAAALQNIGLTESQLLTEIGRGLTDDQADAMVAQYNALAAGHGFVRQTGRRRQ